MVFYEFIKSVWIFVSQYFCCTCILPIFRTTQMFYSSFRGVILLRKIVCEKRSKSNCPSEAAIKDLWYER